MSKEQPEALPVRLAKRLCDGISTGHDWPNTDDELLRMQSASELRRLHAENELLRAQSNDNWQQYATEREETAQAVIERHRGEIKSLLNLLAKDRKELAELRAQIGQGEPDDAAAKERDRILSALKRHDWHSSNIWRYYYPSSTGDWVDLRELRKLLASANPAPQQKPLTDEQIKDCLDAADQMYCPRDGDKEIFKARAIEAAHNIGEKK